MTDAQREAHNERHRNYVRERRAADPEFRATLVRYQREALERNPAARAAKNARRKDLHREAQALLNELKSQPCADCTCTFHPAAMDFDHMLGTKCYQIDASTVLRDDILFELAKCELRCANCHRTRHALVRGETA